MANFASNAKKVSNLTLTENGAVALASTGSSLLDLFSSIGSLKAKSVDEVQHMFKLAIAEDKLLATRLMFYGRDIREGGTGQRETFRRMLKFQAMTDPSVVLKNLNLIPDFGRFDDLYVLIGTPVEPQMWSFLYKTISRDLESMASGAQISLCAKWLKSVNTSSKDSNALGKMTAKAFHMGEAQYRKMLSKLRAYTNVTEVKMSAGDWAGISYSAVASGAMKNYRKAFGKHDPEGFAQFMTKVEKGEVKINASSLYPHDILKKANLREEKSYYSGRNTDRNGYFTIDADRVLEAQWKALKNYVTGENNILVMADTSGSMQGEPLEVALGLAVYFAERNRGVYQNLFMTFAREPQFVTLKGNTLKEKIECIKDICDNTDLEKAFNMILDVAVRGKVSQDEMPVSLVILSDMQFDEAERGHKYETFHETMKRKFEAHGYTMPTVVYWQVAERGASKQAQTDTNGVILISGSSAGGFKHLIANVGRTPMDFMLEVLESEVYSSIRI